MFGLLLTPETKQLLRIVARVRHDGDVDALLEELGEDRTRQVAFQRLLRWYAGPTLGEV